MFIIEIAFQTIHAFGKFVLTKMRMIYSMKFKLDLDGFRGGSRFH